MPSIVPVKTGEDFQTTRIVLSGNDKPRASATKQCSIQGPVFSLSPDAASTSDRWLITSPSIQGWQKRGGDIDVTAEWNSFTSALLGRKELGCFPKEVSLSSITNAIIEHIPLPANESLLFFYSFNGSSGFADLSPGMQIKIEQISIESRNGKATGGKPISLEAQYEVVPSSASGVSLQPSKASRRPSTRSSGQEESFFNLSSRFQATPLLRLFLETAKDGNTKQPALIGASNMADIESATKLIEQSNTGNCPASLTNVVCTPFAQGTGVSLLFPIWVNGKLSYRPIGTTLEYMIAILQANKKSRAIETISLKRPLATGGYAEVVFPRTMEDAGQILLLSGDRLTWDH
ncbi:hypothetical protein [Granulicella sp. S190]|uniref:hypothetical protein n=1 Tax=Granulicella sp. S190 TaxID=1747226 RepID=UPI00131D062D|nr:hypothetical protein [Granulicella sp. S190]